MHHAEHRRALVKQRDQRAPEWKARDKRFRAVDRIQYPDVFGILLLAAELLADNAMLRKIVLDEPPHHRLRRAVGFGDRIEIVAVAFVLDRERRPEERQDGFAGSGRKAADEGCEIDDRHGYSQGQRNARIARPCLTQSRRERTGHGAYPIGIRSFSTDRISSCIRVFSKEQRDHELARSTTRAIASGAAVADCYLSC